MNNSKNNRYEGTNWDPVVTVKRHGVQPSTHRKVLTRGIKQLDAAELLAQAITLLRQGYEVRLTDEEGNEGLRMYPCMNSDFSGMFAAAMTLGELRECLHDKKAIAKNRGKVVDGEELAKEQRSRHLAHVERMAEVTPDSVVQCPKCGHKFRVGKSLTKKG